MWASSIALISLYKIVCEHRRDSNHFDSDFCDEIHAWHVKIMKVARQLISIARNPQLQDDQGEPLTLSDPVWPCHHYDWLGKSSKKTHFSVYRTSYAVISLLRIFELCLGICDRSGCKDEVNCPYCKPDEELAKGILDVVIPSLQYLEKVSEECDCPVPTNGEGTSQVKGRRWAAEPSNPCCDWHTEFETGATSQAAMAFFEFYNKFAEKKKKDIKNISFMFTIPLWKGWFQLEITTVMAWVRIIRRAVRYKQLTVQEQKTRRG